AALALVAGCAYIDPHNMIGRQIGEAETSPNEFSRPGTPALGLEGRERAFDFVWETIRDRYHDPALNGTDWVAVRSRYRPLALAAKDDEDFWELLHQATG